MPAPAPVPPRELATRVGQSPGDPMEVYDWVGRAFREKIEALLPEDWSWHGKRVLDFGCGSARVLRHFLDEAREAEFWGCDIDGPSIEWARENLSPPVHCFQNDPEPPLPLEDGHFDLVWATSVFTHITDNWSGWLLELHRVLAPDGMLISTHLGEGGWATLVNEPYDEDRVGMIVLRHWLPWEQGGPWVFHSEWWLREHWGRAFEILEIDRPRPIGDHPPPIIHTCLVARKGPVKPTAEELEQPAPDEPRELDSIRNNLRLLQLEVEGVVARPPVRTALKELVRRSPLAAPARRLRDGLRRNYL